MRKFSWLLCVTGVLLLLGGASAWACTNLATLNLDTTHAQAGDTVQITGSSYKLTESGGQEVILRWNAFDGPVLASTTPDSSGNIAVSLVIPSDAQPGPHVIVGAQEVERPDGSMVPAHGTPTRASIVVGSAGVDPLEPPAAVSPAASAAASGDGGLLVLGALLGLVGLGLFAAGTGVFLRNVSAEEPVPSPVQQGRR